MDKKDFEEWINKQDWIFAKTYAKTVPHEYIVKDRLPKGDQEILLEFGKFIREKGYENEFWGVKRMYYNIGDNKYWSMDEDVKKIDLINRAKLTQK